MARTTTVAIVFVLFGGPAVAQQPQTASRTITVRGTAELRILPNRASVRLAIETFDEQLDAAKEASDATVRAVLAAFRELNIDEKTISAGLEEVGPQYGRDWPPRRQGYRLVHRISVRDVEVSKLELLMTAAMKAGVNRVDDVSFSSENAATEREKATVAAVTNAKRRAELLAGQFGQAVGRPVYIEESYWEPNEGGGQSVFQGASSTSTFLIGEKRGTVSVTVQFELLDAP